MHLETKNKIINLINSKVLIDEPLKRHTTFGVGGVASIFVYPKNKNDLITLLKYTSKNNIDTFFCEYCDLIQIHTEQQYFSRAPPIS